MKTSVGNSALDHANVSRSLFSSLSHSLPLPLAFCRSHSPSLLPSPSPPLPPTRPLSLSLAPLCPPHSPVPTFTAKQKNTKTQQQRSVPQPLPFIPLSDHQGKLTSAEILQASCSAGVVNPTLRCPLVLSLLSAASLASSNTFYDSRSAPLTLSC